MASARSWLRCLTIEIPSPDESTTTTTADGDHGCSSREAGHNSSIHKSPQSLLDAAPIADDVHHHPFVADIRMPDVSFGRQPSSPGGVTRRDTSIEDQDVDCISSDKSAAISTTTTMTIQKKVYTQRIPPKVPPPPFPQYGNRNNNIPTTVMDAYNKGMLFSHFTSMPSALSCCWMDTTTSATNDQENYERNWSGHQPLVPTNWSPTKDAASIVDNVPEEKCSISRVLSTSEIRYRRSRRRRGIWSPHNNDPALQQQQCQEEEEFFAKR